MHTSLVQVPLLENEIALSTGDGTMSTLLVHPQAPGRYPVVFLYMDAAGRREELSIMARRIAAAGYYTVLPNLYYRVAPSFRMRWDEEGMWEMFALMWSLTNSLVVADTEAALSAISEDIYAAPERLGAVGYCMGAPFAIAAAAHFPERFRAVASIHGTQLVTERADSPHRLVEKVAAELYFACAEFDEWADAATIATLREALRCCPAPYSVELYPGTHHGFVFPERSETYDEAGAARHWDRLFALLHRRLG